MSEIKVLLSLHHTAISTDIS